MTALVLRRLKVYAEKPQIRQNECRQEFVEKHINQVEKFGNHFCKDCRKPIAKDTPVLRQ
jgi:hypothetical protein